MKKRKKKKKKIKARRKHYCETANTQKKKEKRMITAHEKVKRKSFLMGQRQTVDVLRVDPFLK